MLVEMGRKFNIRSKATNDNFIAVSGTERNQEMDNHGKLILATQKS